MIKINFQEPNTDNWREWRAQCDCAQKSHNEATEAGENPQVDDDVYKGTSFNIKSDVYMSLDGPFHGKCVYCETLMAADQDGQIEHFRPKNAVSDKNFKKVEVEVNGKKKDHPGYYWLCYDHKNLLPSCILCNQKRWVCGRLIGKHSRFPVKGQHATQPGEEKNEEPLLLNPVFKDPAEHLGIDETGTFSALSDEGQTCIDIFGLNIREPLIDARRECYKNIKNHLSVLALKLVQECASIEDVDQVKKIKEGRLPYSAAAQKALVDFRNKLQPLF